ncbi:hypothetical protein IRJ41_003310, partial [Triplophysa rosa]
MKFKGCVLVIHTVDPKIVVGEVPRRYLTARPVFNLPTSSTDGTRNTGNILVNTRTFNIKLIDFGWLWNTRANPTPTINIE